MKNVMYAGHELLTSDAVADALLDFVVTLARTQPPERVSIPAVKDGRVTDVQLVVTAVTPLAVASSDAHEQSLPGALRAVEVLRYKASRLDSVGLG